LIDACPDEVYTAGQIAGELDITRRTLERKFQRHLGVSPYQYLLTRRLHLARRILKTGQTSVLTACTRTGFANTSRFAMLYSRQFGELPSQTKGLASY
ncbi:MAG: helix-turn-helix transcriptional regulator, partial [Pirellulaceae bacterium]